VDSVYIQNSVAQADVKVLISRTLLWSFCSLRWLKYYKKRH